MERTFASVWVHSLAYVVGGLAVFLPVLVLQPELGVWATLIQGGVSVALWVGLRWLPSEDAGIAPLVRSLLAASLGLVTMSLIDVGQLGVPLDTAWGIAVAKWVEAGIVVGVALVSLYLLGGALEDLYLTRANWLRNGLIGAGLFVGFVWLSTARPGAEDMTAVLAEHWPFVGVFVLSNAIMEEVLFRGLFLKWLRQSAGAFLAVVISSLVFAVAHLTVNYQSPEEIVGFLVVVFVLGAIWGALTLWTNSLIPSILFHAAADVAMIGEIFRSLSV